MANRLDSEGEYRHTSTVKRLEQEAPKPRPKTLADVARLMRESFPEARDFPDCGQPQPSGVEGRDSVTYRITLELKRLAEDRYLGTSPELPGLVVQGDSLQEVLSLAPEVAHDLIAAMVEADQRLPPGIETVTVPGHVSVLVPA